MACAEVRRKFGVGFRRPLDRSFAESIRYCRSYGSSGEQLESSSPGCLLILFFEPQNGIPARAGLTVGPCAPYACESLLD
jgi:hypothetical protein